MAENTENETFHSLKRLQDIDARISEVKEEVASYEPLLEEVEEPVQELEAEVEELESRLQELKLEERRLELSVEENRSRLEKLEKKRKQVRSVREEDAVGTEIAMVEDAVEADEDEALRILDRIRRTELKLDEMKEKLEEARAEVEPRREEILRERRDAAEKLEGLKDRREGHAEGLGETARELYERLSEGRAGVAVAHLTEDGACGHCFNVIPLQRQAEIKRGSALSRCEACGVILAPPESHGGGNGGPGDDGAEDGGSTEA